VQGSKLQQDSKFKMVDYAGGLQQPQIKGRKIDSPPVLVVKDIDGLLSKPSDI